MSSSASKTKDLLSLEAEYENFYAPAFTIAVDGKDVRAQGAEVAGVSLEKVLDGADQFSFSVNNPFDPAKSDFQWLASSFFEVGKPVCIRLGYGSKLVTMLQGIITAQRYSFPAGGAAQIEVSGYDLSHLMMKGKRSRSWNSKKHSDVVTEIAASYGFVTAKIEDSIVTQPKVQQDQESDYDFIKKLAGLNGFEIFIEETTFYFRKPPRKAEPELELMWGKSLLSFAPEVNIAEQVTEVKVIGWDPAAKKELIGKAAQGEEDGKASGAKSGSELAGKIYKDPVVEEIRRPVYSQAEADRLAKAMLNQRAEGLVKGTGESIGLPLLKPGITIRLVGLGKKFSRTYYLEKTSHSIGTSGYKTTFSIKENSL